MICPKCGKGAKFLGIGKQKSTSLYHNIFECCGKIFMDNPGKKSIKALAKTKSYQKAVKLYENFNMKPADKVYVQQISLPSKTNPLVHLGHISGLIYISDKEGKKGQQYIHECEAPYPSFYATTDGQTFIINGGKLKIKRGWLYY